MRDTTRSVAQDLLGSLQGQEHIAEVRSSGYLAGVGHDGVIFGPSELPNESNRRVILEVSQSPVVTPAVARERLRRLSAIAAEDGDVRTLYLFLTSGDVTRGARDVLHGSGVVIRSRRSFQDLCSDFWNTLAPDYEDPGLTDRAKQLIEALSVMPSGRPSYPDYERVCCEILEYLFCPDLGQPDPQSYTVNRSQRRDVVMDNHVEQGFWARIRERYQADYLVAEMKNNNGSVSNTSVWQLAASVSPSPSASVPACAISSRPYPRMPGRPSPIGWTAPPMWPRPLTLPSEAGPMPRRCGSSSGG